MNKREMARLEKWARVRLESIAPELANFGLIDIALNDPLMGEQLLREPSSRLMPSSGNAHFGIKTAKLPPAEQRPRALKRCSRRSAKKSL